MFRFWLTTVTPVSKIVNLWIRTGAVASWVWLFGWVTELYLSVTFIVLHSSDLQREVSLELCPVFAKFVAGQSEVPL